jgi:hypothetical protein
MRARLHLFARSRTLASQASFRAANPALTHVLERMLVSHTPAFRVYPSAQEEGMPPFGRIGTPGPRILLALDHPNFEHTDLDCLREAYRDRISPESAAAKTHANGMEVFLCKPENKVVQKSEIVEPVDLSKDTIELGVRGSIHHVIVWSYETVPRDACFGGWPAAALVPTTPLRLLRFDVRTMWPESVPNVQVRAASALFGEAGFAPDVSFERGGVPLDCETTLGELCDWARDGVPLDVVVNGTRVPLRFEPKYARRGAEAGEDEVRRRRPADIFFTIAFAGSFGLMGYTVWDKVEKGRALREASAANSNAAAKMDSSPAQPRDTWQSWDRDTSRGQGED